MQASEPYSFGVEDAEDARQDGREGVSSSPLLRSMDDTIPCQTPIV